MIAKTTAASCPNEITNSTRGSYQWPETNAEDSVALYCAYGAVDGLSQVRRNCSDRGTWVEPELGVCRTYSNSLLLNISQV